ncbi:MAG: hypothetical protein ACP5MK_02660 [Candidatus Micrarchaeia archaeon]
MEASAFGYEEIGQQLPSIENRETHGLGIDEIASNIVRKEWTAKIKQAEMRELLENHVQKINSILGSKSYEVCIMKDFAATAKGMGSDELRRYIKMVEALSYAYKSEFGSELAEALVIGMVSKAKSLENMRKFYTMYVDRYGRRIRKLEDKSRKESAELESLVLKLKYNESSLFKFLRKKRITAIRRRIRVKDRRISALSAKIGDRKKFLSTILEMGK